MKINLVADIVPTPMIAKAFENGDAKTIFSDTLPLLHAADYTVANLECALTDGENKIRKYGPNLKGAPACAKTLKKAGITHCSLANNHSADYDIDGLYDTVRHLSDVGIPSFGYGENDTASRTPLYLEKDGVKVAVIAVCEHEYTYAKKNLAGANPFNPFQTMFDIRDAKKNADFVVVMYHGGTEHCRFPSPRVRAACTAMAKHGADLVMTQHTHCIGCVEKVGDSTVIYGTGNFCFPGYVDKEAWQTGLLVTATFTDKCEISLHPIINTDCGIRLTQDKETEEIFKGMDERSKMLETDAWLEGFKEFCKNVREAGIRKYVGYTEDPTKDERERGALAHYIDCEAHLDVLRNIYTTWHMDR